MIPSFAFASLENNLISWWDFENNGIDSHLSNDLTPVNGASYSPGKVGTSADINGNTQYFNLSGSTNIDFSSSDDRTWAFWVKRGSGTTRDRIMGVWGSNGKNSMFLFWDSGQLNISSGEDNITIDTYQASTDISDGSWHFVVVTYYGSGDDRYRVYVDGATYPEAISPAYANLAGSSLDFRIGYVDGNAPDMQIDSVGIWSRLLDSTEITELYNSGNGISYSDFASSSSTTTASTTATSTPPTSTTTPIVIDFDWASTTQVNSATWTIAMLPDTQNLSWANSTVYNNLIQWVADNVAEKNIQFVTSVGDVVEDPLNSGEWQTAQNAFARLDGVVPHGMTMGNHDYDTKWNQMTSGTRFASQWNNYFPLSDHSNDPWLVSSYPENTSENTAAGIVINGEKFLFLNVEFSPRNGVVDWVNQVIASTTPDKTVLTTHYFLDNGAVRYDSSNHDAGYTSGACFYDPTDCNTAVDMWDEIITQNENIILVLNGHSPSTSEVRVDYVNGSPVNQHAFNYQNNTGSNYADSAWVRLYTCDGQTCEATSYNPISNIYKTGSSDQFTFEIEATTTSTSTPPEPDPEYFACLGLFYENNVLKSEEINCPS